MAELLKQMMTGIGVSDEIIGRIQPFSQISDRSRIPKKSLGKTTIAFLKNKYLSKIAISFNMTSDYNKNRLLKYLIKNGRGKVKEILKYGNPDTFIEINKNNSNYNIPPDEARQLELLSPVLLKVAPRTFVFCYTDNDNRAYGESNLKCFFIGKYAYSEIKKLKNIFLSGNQSSLPIIRFDINFSNRGMHCDSVYELDENIVSEETLFIDKKIMYNIYNYIHSVKFLRKSFKSKNQVCPKIQPGILLYGEPGTGKTSLIKAISHHLGNVPIVFMGEESIDKIYFDSKNFEREWDLHGKTFILAFEDIDLMTQSRSNIDMKNNKTVLKRLLKILDGTFSKDTFCISIATTNDIEALDSALIRPGRFDLHIEMGRISKELAVNMCKSFNVNPEKTLKGEEFPINPSYLQSKIINSYRKDILNKVTK